MTAGRVISVARILYFASLVEALGKSSEEVSVPSAGVPVKWLLARLRARGGPWSVHLRDDRVQVTINKKFVELDETVTDSDDVAIVPTRRE
ncbi:MoaD/ThiS family protein [Pelomicrobium methylotrophicum]|uniref:MoaD/ThiS family protein n=1 Tax=Pelomicrobium methylotrophicum TaxID=2602750 RepID=A0A5C7ERW1_9PROT|nr:MoaD/ThiS family protein [Pelomicrobium methylotrophicum]